MCRVDPTYVTSAWTQWVYVAKALRSLISRTHRTKESQFTHGVIALHIGPMRPAKRRALISSRNGTWPMQLPQTEQAPQVPLHTLWLNTDVVGGIMSYVTDAESFVNLACLTSRTITRLVTRALCAIDVDLPMCNSDGAAPVVWFVRTILQRCAVHQIKHLKLMNVGCASDAVIGLVHSVTRGIVSLEMVDGSTTSELSRPKPMRHRKHMLEWPSLQKLRIPIARSLSVLKNISAPCLHSLEIVIVGCQFHTRIYARGISLLGSVESLSIACHHGTSPLIDLDASTNWRSLLVTNHTHIHGMQNKCCALTGFGFNGFDSYYYCRFKMPCTLPSVTHLYVINVDPYVINRSLYCRSSEQAMLPALKTITIRLSYDSGLKETLTERLHASFPHLEQVVYVDRA